MQPWQLLEQVFTVETIMTPRVRLLVWDQSEPVEPIKIQAEKCKIDTIPVVDGDQIIGVLRHGEDTVIPLTDKETIAHTVSIPTLIQSFVELEIQYLFIVAEQGVIGLVAPADLNQMASRTYFYSLMAELERRIANHIRDHFDDDKQIWSLIEDTDKQEKMQKKMAESSLELNVVHTLLISDMVNIIRKDKRLRERLGFPSNNQVEKKLNGLVHFRNDIMHPANLILSNTVGIVKLHQRIQRIFELLERI